MLDGLLGVGQQSGLLGQQDPFGSSMVAQARAQQAHMNAMLGRELLGLRGPIQIYNKEPETLREELQLETDDWLKDTI